MGTTGQSITLANSIIGVGILAMPFCFQQCGVFLATLILLFMGLISRLCCHFLLKSALLARRRNFEFLAFHVFGQAGKFAVEVGIIGFLMGTCIAYFVVVGDLGPQIVAKMFNINQSDILRTSIMVIVSLVCVLPLGLLRNVDSLSNVSAATIAFYFCLVMKVIFEAGGVMLTSDWSQRVETWRPAGLLQCVPIFSMALFCQTQLFEIFESLPTLSLEKMNIVTKNAINICTAVYFTLGIFGYIAFSSHEISGNILMSLSPTWASDVIKLGFVMSLAFSFPLIIFPCRASLYSFLYKKVHSSHHDHIINHSIPEPTFRVITVGIVGVALFISLLIPNIELVLGLVGSTIGVLICVVFPAACFVNVTFKNTNERVLAKGVLVLGLVIMVLGTYANLQVAESSIEHYDEKYTQEKIDKIVEDFFEHRDKDDIYLKPPPNNEPPKDPPEGMVLNKERKDSEVQPPNPVPPESQSNEKMSLTKNINKADEKEEILQVQEVKEAAAKVSEIHPRNLKTKLETKLANGEAKLANGETKVANSVSNGEAKPKEDKPPSNEDKIDMMKQQQLIETIKQHGEEQKELIKEQKELLDEIKKTKKELQQNKNEAVGASEAKKIAVESIKQIADMAIKSIGGVSEKPDLVKNDVNEGLEKLTNDAVQEIAKKAVETIEAIQDIKEKPEQVNAIQPAQPVQNVVPNAQPVQNVVPNVQPVQNGVPNAQTVQNVVPNAQPVQNVVPNAQPVQNVLQQNAQQNVQVNPAQNVPQYVQANPAQNVQANPARNVQANQNVQLNQNVQPNQQNVQPQPPVNPQVVQAPTVVRTKNEAPNIPANKVLQTDNVANQNNGAAIQNVANNNVANQNNAAVAQSNIAPNVNQQPIQDTKPVVNEIPKVPAQIPNSVQNAPQVNKPIQPEINAVKQHHAHSLDEPQSYKQGEDTQAKPETKLVQNVPPPIVNELANNQMKIEKKTAVNNVQINAVPEVQKNGAAIQQSGNSVPVANAVPHIDNPVLGRQKREVVDCTDKVSLKSEDKQICSNLVDGNKDSEEMLAKTVDMNDIALPKNLPMDANILHHISRQLKSFDKDER
ncbi:hypothetical protein PYW07_013687 [Mythimna separata]|uniref:Amino acid transporter transmembrane domain-containing protein n=1 Tax=Mythimna separata TaxID=271217 RepID=A0AAD7YFY1_MYTSE|nr:hypothetical protein PYW07_013687 [Mythimna separata]